MRVVLLGPPGAGKGTFCDLLKKHFDLLQIATGDMLRDEMRQGTDLGLKIKSLIEKGDLVPDELVTQLVDQLLNGLKDKSQSLLFDGYPRTLAQAQDLDKVLDEIGLPIDVVLYLETTPSIIIARLSGRRICSQCKAVYHETNRPPKTPGVCDQCGSTDLIQRKDDSKDVVEHRLEVYHETTMPLIEYYEKTGRLKRVDGDKDPEELEEDLLRFLDE